MRHQILFGVVIALTAITSAIVRSSAGHRERDAPVTQTRFGRLVPTLALLMGLFFATNGLIGFLNSGQRAYLIFVVVGTLAILFFLPFLVSSALKISAGTLVGPSMAFGPFLGFQRDAVSIDDIQMIGNTPFGYSYYEATDGKRIYFSKSYLDYRAFAQTLNARRSSREPLPERLLTEDRTNGNSVVTKVSYRAGRMISRLMRSLYEKKDV